MSRVGIKDVRPPNFKSVCMFYTGHRTHADYKKYRKLQRRLKEFGHWSRTIELPNHGRAIDDRHGSVNDFNEVLEIAHSAMLVLRHDPFYNNEPVFLIGHSAGVIGILSALRRWSKVQPFLCGVVLFSSPFHLETNAPKLVQYLDPLLRRVSPTLMKFRFMRRLRVGTRKLRKAVKKRNVRDPFYFHKDINLGTMFEVHRASAHILPRVADSVRNVKSLLVLHGMDDENAFEKHAKEAFEGVIENHPDAEYHGLPGVGHEMDPLVVKIISEWIDERTLSTKQAKCASESTKND